MQMKFSVPFTFSNIDKLTSRSAPFSSRFRHKKDSSLEEYLKWVDVDLTREEYLGIVLRSFVNLFLILFIVFSISLLIIGIGFFYLIGAGLAVMIAAFTSFSQLVYPRVFVSRKEKDIERNLIFALEDISIQLNSGIPLFDILTNISNSNYGELSVEFGKAVKRIGSGEPEAKVLADLSARSRSVFFKRTLWQISNGLNAGSDMSLIIRDSIKTLNEEQVIQIQNYGNKLNPLIMMYMLISVIVPALSVSFMTVVASMIGLEENLTKGMFVGLFVFVVFFQVMFLGMIKSRRPSLL
ncbi:type II secretion system F family protein [Methanococcoides sp. SA1]|nr:type II secretion system F family protein [Methanococcoides sp. SA1]